MLTQSSLLIATYYPSARSLLILDNTSITAAMDRTLTLQLPPIKINLGDPKGLIPICYPLTFGSILGSNPNKDVFLSIPFAVPVSSLVSEPGDLGCLSRGVGKGRVFNNTRTLHNIFRNTLPLGLSTILLGEHVYYAGKGCIFDKDLNPIVMSYVTTSFVKKVIAGAYTSSAGNVTVSPSGYINTAISDIENMALVEELHIKVKSNYSIASSGIHISLKNWINKFLGVINDEISSGSKIKVELVNEFPFREYGLNIPYLEKRYIANYGQITKPDFLYKEIVKNILSTHDTVSIEELREVFNPDRDARIFEQDLLTDNADTSEYIWRKISTNLDSSNTSSV